MNQLHSRDDGFNSGPYNTPVPANNSSFGGVPQAMDSISFSSSDLLDTPRATHLLKTIDGNPQCGKLGTLPVLETNDAIRLLSIPNQSNGANLGLHGDGNGVQTNSIPFAAQCYLVPTGEEGQYEMIYQQLPSTSDNLGSGSQVSASEFIMNSNDVMDGTGSNDVIPVPAVRVLSDISGPIFSVDDPGLQFQPNQSDGSTMVLPNGDQPTFLVINNLLYLVPNGTDLTNSGVVANLIDEASTSVETDVNLYQGALDSGRSDTDSVVTADDVVKFLKNQGIESDSQPSLVMLNDGDQKSVGYLVPIPPDVHSGSTKKQIRKHRVPVPNLNQPIAIKQAHSSLFTGAKPDIVGFQCPECGFTSAQKYNLTKHMQTHSGYRPHKCNVCDRSFKAASVLANHMNTHTGRKPFQCTECNKRFRTSGEAYRHKQYIHSDERPQQCPFCDYSCVEMSKLNRHLKTHTGEKPYKCSFCPYSFSDNFKLKRHQRVHTGEKPYECEICLARFSQSNSLKAHKVLHLMDAPEYPCKYCDYKSKRANDIRVHVKYNHTAKFTLDCNKCGQVFADRFNLRNHKKTHIGEKCFKCTLCDYTAEHARTVKTHMTVHNEGTPFVCEVGLCQKSFKSPALLKKHYNTFHNPEYESESTQLDRRGARHKVKATPKFPCSLCDRQFCLQLGLDKHVNLRHGLSCEKSVASVASSEDSDEQRDVDIETVDSTSTVAGVSADNESRSCGREDANNGPSSSSSSAPRESLSTKSTGSPGVLLVTKPDSKVVKARRKADFNKVRLPKKITPSQIGLTEVTYATLREKSVVKAEENAGTLPDGMTSLQDPRMVDAEFRRLELLDELQCSFGVEEMEIPTDVTSSTNDDTMGELENPIESVVEDGVAARFILLPEPDVLVPHPLPMELIPRDMARKNLVALRDVYDDVRAVVVTSHSLDDDDCDRPVRRKGRMQDGFMVHGNMKMPPAKTIEVDGVEMPGPPDIEVTMTYDPYDG